MSIKSITLVCLLLVFTVAARAATLLVGPGQQYATIQSAIAAASDGDTVLVAPGTYYENIDFLGKAITVTSSAGPALTILDGNSNGVPAVTFKTGEPLTAVLSSLTIRNGGGVALGAGSAHGGVYVFNSTPTILNNVITQNFCFGVSNEEGAPLIKGNEISATRYGGVHGGCFPAGGAAIYSGAASRTYSATIYGNTIENNVQSALYDGNGGEGGAGIYLTEEGITVIQNNIIRNNTTLYGSGGGIYTGGNGSAYVVQNLIYGNQAGCGGGAISNESFYIAIVNNTIFNNTGSRLSGSSNCLNSAQYYPDFPGSGMTSTATVLYNNIFSGNTSYPAVNCNNFGIPSLTPRPLFQNDLLFNAGGPFFGSSCTDVSAQNGNIVADPRFVNSANGDFHLTAISPAIDAGNNDILQILKQVGINLTQDLDGNPRVQAVNSTTCLIDMGAYEYPSANNNCGVNETLQSSLNPSVFGQSVTFTAQLSSTTGTPTGTVQFTDGSSILGTQFVSATGTASFTTSALAVGSHLIVAVYQPAGSFTAATANVTQIVNGYPAGITVASSVNPSAAGQSVLFTATVQYSQPVQGAGFGSVTFSDGSMPLQTVSLTPASTGLNPSYLAGYSTAALAAGDHAITATLNPPAKYVSTSAGLRQTVTALSSTAMLKAAPTTAMVGSLITLTATVVPASAPGPATLTGTVTFFQNGGAWSGVGTLGLVAGVSTAMLSTQALPIGVDQLTCMYSGDATYASSACNVIPVNLTAATTTLTLSSGSNPSTALTPVTFTAHLGTGTQPAAGNTIVLTLGSAPPVSLSTDAGGNAVYTATNLTPGTYSVNASFAATVNLLGSTAPLTQVVTSAATTTTLTASPNPAYPGQTVTLAATVAGPGGYAPPGAITFFDAGTPLGTAALSATGQATLTTSSLAVGNHPLSAAYGASTSFAASASPVVNESILTSGFNIALSPASITLAPGSSGTVAVQVVSISNFAGPLALTYGTLPRYGTASLSPAVVTLAAGGSASSTLTLSTLLISSNAVPARPGTKGPPIVLAGIMFLLMPFSLRRRGAFRLCITLILLLGGLQAITGCTNSWYTGNVISAGTYQLLVTATDVNQNRESATLTVIVTP